MVIQTVALTCSLSPFSTSLFTLATVAYKDFAGFGEESIVSTELEEETVSKVDFKLRTVVYFWLLKVIPKIILIATVFFLKLMPF